MLAGDDEQADVLTYWIHYYMKLSKHSLDCLSQQLETIISATSMDDMYCLRITIPIQAAEADLIISSLSQQAITKML